jgi:hypothetical protein
VKTYKNENSVKAEINKLLNEHNWFWWSTPMNGFGKTGISDKLAFRGGILIAIEAKFGYNKPTTMQKAFLESIRAESGFGFVVNEKNIGWLKGFLEAFDRSIEAGQKKEMPSEEDGAYMVNAIRELSFGGANHEMVEVNDSRRRS